MSLRAQASPGCDSPPAKASRDVFNYMVTPDRIPQFIIPSLDIQEGHRLFSKRKAQRSSSDPTGKTAHALPCPLLACSSLELAVKVEEISDPIARAALSLPHLPKITTPYGFITLGKSPQVTNEEALFFHLDFASPKCPGGKPPAPEKPGSRRDPEMPTAPTDGCSQVAGCLQDWQQHRAQQTSCRGSNGSQGADHPARPLFPQRRSSPIRSKEAMGVLGSREAERLEGERKSFETVCQKSTSSPELRGTKPQRNSLQRILKKCFAQLKLLKSMNFTLH
ncbi:PREDICTED: C2 calcium-dependent domain-containing protein 4A-like [Gavialis gangeticus]|uniref:C2 calcium-dependent domain-containing protein 4A-like n=1 Tax=Gavialis gangeticus TaxID=94835 RepID=UPI00092EB6E6|nr:PREDICTED: C2 calcium-dependent domain-containing protein 4A-like [Gavialis gangeticus]